MGKNLIILKGFEIEYEGCVKMMGMVTGHVHI